MFEMLYAAVVVICLGGECESFTIDYNLTLPDCVELIFNIQDETDNIFVPAALCEQQKTSIQV